MSVAGVTGNTSAQCRRDTIRVSAANQARSAGPYPAGLPAQHRILMPEHQHFGRYRPVAAQQNDDQAKCPPGQHVDDLEKHPPSQPSPCPACQRQCRSTTQSSIRAVQVFIEHGTRRMHLGGVTAIPTGEWTVQQARILALSLDQRFGDIRFLIHDRGSNFTASFDAVFGACGIRILRTAVQAPRMNAICERLGGTLRREVLDRTLILGQAHLRAVIMEYQTHYNTARPHQGIAQHVPDADRDVPRATVTDLDTTRIHRRPVLGGLINEYTHAA